jgi:dihydroorotate dehydrogenase
MVPSRGRAHRSCSTLFLFRPLLFAADPETAHAAAFKALDTAARLGIAQTFAPKLPADPATVMGITFPNRVGLAAVSTRMPSTVGTVDARLRFHRSGNGHATAPVRESQPRLFRSPRRRR